MILVAKRFLLGISVFSISLLTSCSINPEGCEKLIPTYSLEEVYGCVNTPYQMEIELTEDFRIIRSQPTFEALVTGSCIPQLDFAKYDLIIGKKFLTNGLSSINYRMIEKCENQKKILFVDITKNMATVAPNITYHVLIPKIGERESVEVIIE